MFGYLELSDIPMACDMACAGKLTGIDFTKHHRLSNTLIGQMLNSYGSYKRLYSKNVQTPIEKKKVSKEAKEKVFKEEVDYQYNQIKKGVVNRKDYSHKARLFRWLQEKKEEDISWNIETIRENNRNKILQTTTIKTVQDKRILKQWDSGDNDEFDVKLKNMIECDLFIQYIQKCIEEDKYWL